MDKKYLSDAHMRKLDIHHEKQKARALEVKNLELQRKILELNKLVFSLRGDIISKDIKLLEKELADTRIRHSTAVSDHKLWLKELKGELGIVTDNWGFNPESGEIHESSEEETRQTQSESEKE